ncbi:uncharacterized protein BJ171DRAFT_601452 [Polychytrium aggregatum]|uniref:uncharacterized protein n=1 Tax=Polychytrium aggregatum TaxID=110093 RepID=UPI0022FE5061|nr:uncharacterized protein BJ171DRAFT_601452 [Polychytrium aggregatum]KAI9201884.1 hypothetical protein BJ171DRAFT_601452 [Polychytrium aggregatum]
MADTSIKIAVRVRPFNTREIERQAKLSVSMDGATTILKREGDEEKKFTFDYSYWSHDGFDEKEDGLCVPKSQSHYADQKRVFEDLGRAIVQNAWDGFNTSLLAYGQTGSGKSYSMFGYGANKGLIPMICDELFTSMAKKGSEDVQFRVLFSMIEIYQEKVRDLITGSQESLKVRHNPTIGFYVEDLKSVPVQNYKEIEMLSEKGTRNRTIAATRMNATSSRSHTIIMITFIQVSKADNTEKRSIINLVDLAGSERTDSAGTEGERLKEGVNINSSLSVLGQVIAALVAKQSGKNKTAVVPYRDSTLTKLLANALGGNSKTVMIAALSPADINYEETLSTLRFMDRAKQIKTQAVVNESPIDKLIRELKEENEALKRKMVEAGGKGGSGEDAQLRQQIMEYDKAIADLNKSWQQRLEEVQKQKEEDTKAEKAKENRKNAEPYLKNINEDPLLSGMMIYFIQPGKMTIGLKRTGKADIPLSGLSIRANHAIVACSQNDATVIVNGRPLTKNTESLPLEHNARILIGTQHLFVLKLPSVADDPTAEPTWESAQEEIARASGFGKDELASQAMQLIYNDITEILPAIREINAIAEALKKTKKFELLLKTKEMISKELKNSEAVCVQINDFYRHIKWIWDKSKFMDMRVRMQEMYTSFVEGGLEALQKWTKDKDPFEVEPVDWHIGNASVSLKNLPYLIDIRDTVMINNLVGGNEGILKVSISLKIVDRAKGDKAELGSDPNQLLTRTGEIQVTLHSAMGIRWKKGEIYARYQLPFQVKEPAKAVHQTKAISNTSNPQFDDGYATKFTITQECLGALQSQPLVVSIFGIHNLEAIKQVYGDTPLPANLAPERPVTASPSEEYKSKLEQLSERILKSQSKEEIEKVRKELAATVSQIQKNLGLAPAPPPKTPDEVMDGNKKTVQDYVKALVAMIAKIQKIKDPKKAKEELAVFVMSGIEKLAAVNKAQLSAEDKQDPALEIKQQAISDATAKIKSIHAAELGSAQSKEDYDKIVKELNGINDTLTKNVTSPPKVAPDLLQRREKLNEATLALQKRSNEINQQLLKVLRTAVTPAQLQEIEKHLDAITKTIVAVPPAVDSKGYPSAAVLDSCEKALKAETERVESVAKVVGDVAKISDAQSTAEPLSPEDQTRRAELETKIQSKGMNGQDNIRVLEDVVQQHKIQAERLAKATQSGVAKTDTLQEQSNKLMVEIEYMRKEIERLSGDMGAESEAAAMREKKIGETMSVLATAENQLKEQVDRMNHLQSMIKRQVERGDELESSSKTTQLSLQRMREEIERLNVIIDQRSEDHRKEYQRLTDQIVDKNQKIAQGLKEKEDLQEEIAVLRGEQVRLVALVESAEKLRKALLEQTRPNSPTSGPNPNAEQELAVLRSQSQAAEVEISDLKKELEIARGRLATAKELETALKGTIQELNFMYKQARAAYSAAEGRASVAKAPSLQNVSNKVYPSDVSTAPTTTKSKCLVM